MEFKTKFNINDTFAGTLFNNESGVYRINGVTSYVNNDEEPVTSYFLEDINSNRYEYDADESEIVDALAANKIKVLDVKYDKYTVSLSIWGVVDTEERNKDEVIYVPKSYTFNNDDELYEYLNTRIASEPEFIGNISKELGGSIRFKDFKILSVTKEKEEN
jgi:hypothetical protein